MKKLALSLLIFLAPLGLLAQVATFQAGPITSSNASCVVGACVSMQLPLNTGTVSVVLAGTFSATVQFEASYDGSTTWISVNGTPQPSGNAVTSATATGTWTFAVAGANFFRVRASAYTSGVVQTSIQASTASAVNAGISIVGPSAGGNPCANPSAAITGLVVSTSGTSATQIIAASAGKQVYICSALIGNGAGTTPTLSLEYGTGSNCATSPTVFLAATAIPAGTAAPLAFPTNFFATPSSQAVCYVQTGTGPTGTLTINYVQQ